MKARRGQDQFTAEAAKLLTTFPADGELSREDWGALTAIQTRLGVAMKESGAVCTHLGGVAGERGGPQDPNGADLPRYLNRRERAELDAALTRGIDAMSAAAALGTWINAHHAVLTAAVAQRTGAKWPQTDVDQLLDNNALFRRLRRTLR